MVQLELEKIPLLSPLSLMNLNGRDKESLTEVVSDRIFEELTANARILMDGHDYEWALQLLERILIQVPYNKWALEKMAQCAIELKEFSLAIDCYQKSTLIYGNQKYRLGLANALYRAEQNDSALDLYFDMKETLTKVDLYCVFRNIGNIYARKKEFDKAREYYERALTLCPVSDELRVNYGILEIQEGHFDKALRWFRKALESNSYNDGAWVSLAILHNQYGDGDLSWANLEKALDINPINETALHLYFQWGLKNYKMKQVEKRYQVAAAQYPYRTDLFLAKIYFCLGHFKEARSYIDIFLAHNYQHKEGLRLKKLIDDFALEASSYQPVSKEYRR